MKPVLRGFSGTRRGPSARWRLALLYTTLFAVGGGVLIAVTYALLDAHLTIPDKARPANAPQVLDASQVAACYAKLAQRGLGDARAKASCSEAYAKGIAAGANGQRAAVLNGLLGDSLLALAALTIISAGLGWFVAGRILRPVHKLTVAARAASEQDLSHRLALSGPHDELRELADTFDEMLDRLDGAFRSQQRFIANASHELRTPLTVTRTAIEVVLAKPAPSIAELTGMAHQVHSAVAQAEELIDALLALARAPRTTPALEPLDLAVLVEDALDAQPAAAVSVHATLRCSPVRGDRVLLTRLIANLLSNALRYNVKDGLVWITTDTARDESVVRVVNTGPVVPEADLDRLFEPFTRLTDRTAHDGFGLGLALVRSIATMHGAHIATSANRTGGLDVTVRLPAPEPDAQPDGSLLHVPGPGRLR